VGEDLTLQAMTDTEREVFRAIRNIAREKKFGAVVVKIQDGRIVEWEETKKVRAG
jgi:hypothetical protein